MKTDPKISDYMRELQKKSAKKQWGNLTPEEKSERMKKVRSATKKNNLKK